MSAAIASGQEKGTRPSHTLTRAQTVIYMSGLSGPYIGGYKTPGNKKDTKPAFILGSNLGSDVGITLVTSYPTGKSA
ncbi:hypothetical protein B0H65DRAFT_474984 [Neurospora tetraspora]|uniref:Uncharacterized protein n=1 Tax=Neurospora tetraspora TaxID=94610 RepID=A0AAE0J8E0_9PEZI|nr:hypothetical protein B0H65DRAFT_474984 [Neurospora tetraspora]